MNRAARPGSPPPATSAGPLPTAPARPASAGRINSKGRRGVARLLCGDSCCARRMTHTRVLHPDCKAGPKRSSAGLRCRARSTAMFEYLSIHDAAAWRRTFLTAFGSAQQRRRGLDGPASRDANQTCPRIQHAPIRGLAPWPLRLCAPHAPHCFAALHIDMDTGYRQIRPQGRRWRRRGSQPVASGSTAKLDSGDLSLLPWE